MRDLIIHEKKKKTGRSGALIFLDWKKAYDRLERSFLEKAMVFFGIPEPFIKQVKNNLSKYPFCSPVRWTVIMVIAVLRGASRSTPRMSTITATNLPLSQGEAFTLASISYLAILVKYILAKNHDYILLRSVKACLEISAIRNVWAAAAARLCNEKMALVWSRTAMVPSG